MNTDKYLPALVTFNDAIYYSDFIHHLFEYAYNAYIEDLNVVDVDSIINTFKSEGYIETFDGVVVVNMKAVMKKMRVDKIKNILE